MWKSSYGLHHARSRETPGGRRTSHHDVDYENPVMTYLFPHRFHRALSIRAAARATRENTRSRHRVKRGTCAVDLVVPARAQSPSDLETTYLVRDRNPRSCEGGRGRTPRRAERRKLISATSPRNVLSGSWNLRRPRLRITSDNCNWCDRMSRTLLCGCLARVPVHNRNPIMNVNVRS